ncbi:MAG: LPS export ABC transporter permease LptG [Syntrophorhabdaceae bacterium]|nr:LPS export ABC transporter permease LptG [Syntrophorhabdaceae bacterium]
MKRLNRYLITNVSKILLISEFAGLAMFITIEFFEKMNVFTTSLTNFMLSLLYLILRIPYYFNLLLPLTLLISILIILILMIRNNEMIIIRTSGISTISIMKPLIFLSLFLIVFSFILSEWVIPFTLNSSEYIYRVKLKKEEPYVFFKNDRIWFKREKTINNIDFFDAKRDIIKGLTVIELSEDYGIKRRIDAKEGQWKDGSWYFTDIVERTFDNTGIKTRQVYKSLKDVIKEPPSTFKVVNKSPEEMGYKELSRYIKRLQMDGHDIRRYLVDLYDKIAFPFINLIMVLAAFSVGLRYTKTKHISKGIFSGVSLGALYWFFHSVSLSFGYSEIFPPLFAAWLSNFLFFSAGIVGIVTLRT